MKHCLVIAGILLVMFALPNESFAKGGKDKTVDCDASTDDLADLTKALDKAKKGDVINVKGTCVDIALVISDSNVTLRGEGSASTSLQGTGSADVIRVEEAGGVTIEGMELSGGTTGLFGSAARVNLTDVKATDNINGFVPTSGSTFTCDGCVGDGNSSWGALSYSTIVLCGNNSFSDNGRDGILAHLGGRVYSNGDLCANPPEIAADNNGTSGNGHGISLFQNGSVFIDGAKVSTSHNANLGLSVVDSSSAVIGNSDITMLGNGQFSVLSYSASSTRLNADPTPTAMVTDKIAFSDHHSTFYSNGSYPNGLIFCGADGGGEGAPGCPP